MIRSEILNKWKLADEEEKEMNRETRLKEIERLLSTYENAVDKKWAEQFLPTHDDSLWLLSELKSALERERRHCLDIAEMAVEFSDPKFNKEDLIHDLKAWAGPEALSEIEKLK